jgi:hypothetical protein
LWYAIYWLIFLVALLTVDYFLKFRKRTNLGRFSLHLLVTSFVSTVLAHWFLIGVRRRTSLANESPLDSLKSFWGLYVTNGNSRLYHWEVWSNVLGPHIWVSMGMGILIGLFKRAGAPPSVAFPRVFRRALLAATALLPVVFVAQEFATYQAYWHRTTPIALSSICAILYGIHFGDWLRSRIDSVRFGFVSIVAAIVLTSAVSNFRTDFREIERFSHSWDAGDPFGIGSPHSKFHATWCLSTSELATTCLDSGNNCLLISGARSRL